MVRYVDSGSRQPQEALGAWLGQELLGTEPPVSLRVQTGFFGSSSLGYFETALTALEQSDGHTRFLVGSNDGQTLRSAVADLLSVSGHPRAGLRIGVVSFQSGFFHPKVYHFGRPDGSSTAYVGSANMTSSGVRSLHVEAGLILDSRSGDSPTALAAIADSIDEWFSSSRHGLYEVSVEADLDPLVQANVLGVVQPIRQTRTVKPAQLSSSSKPVPGYSLNPLVVAPPVQKPLPTTTTASGPQPAVVDSGEQKGQSGVVALSTAQPTPPPKSAAVKHWGKTLSDSDAQRKKTGNQRGAITLVQGDYRGKIDQTKYFRADFFGSQTWQTGVANTGQAIEEATVPMKVTIDGTYHGTMDFLVTNGTSRQASQNNYTAELHIEPIRPIIQQSNISRKHLDLTLDANGDYWLTIA